MAVMQSKVTDEYEWNLWDKIWKWRGREMALRISQLFIGLGMTCVRSKAGNSIFDPAKVKGFRSALLKLVQEPCKGLLWMRLTLVKGDP